MTGQHAVASSTRQDVDAAVLEQWMSVEGIGSGPVTNLERIGGGTQNVLVRFQRGPHAFVLRRGPSRMRPQSNAVIEREITILTALADTSVPIPRIIASCDDPTLIGSAFYLMDHLDGFNPVLELPEPHHESRASSRTLAFEAVDALVELGRLDPATLGLSERDTHGGFLAHQLDRWTSHLEGYGPGLDGEPWLPGVGEVGAWLAENRPVEAPVGILHGDFHPANLLFRRTDCTIQAIVDWELWTVGDPLLDLGLLLAAWPVPELRSPMTGVLAKVPDLPAPHELRAHYDEVGGRDTSAIDWYAAMACFKTAIVAEGTHVRSVSGAGNPKLGRAVHRIALGLIDRAKHHIRGDIRL